jgi:hypothetical protein
LANQKMILEYENKENGSIQSDFLAFFPIEHDSLAHSSPAYNARLFSRQYC